MPLDIMSPGKTSDEARRALDEAVHLYLVTATDMTPRWEDLFPLVPPNIESFPFKQRMLLDAFL
ncbi:MAG: hypothetical protein ABSB32_14450 [Thermodesulfobacteriota bacterium]|jgi:hypothetical protein